MVIFASNVIAGERNSQRPVARQGALRGTKFQRSECDYPASMVN
jgi:hypothetical protein